MKNSILTALLSTGIVLALNSCQSNNKPNSDKSMGDSLNNKAVKNDVQQEDDSYILPSPLQIGSIFKNAGLSYLPGITNSVKDVSQYTSTYSEALNTGIYGADLSYCVLNKQTQDALNYLKAVKSLADKLGFGNVFESGSLAKRFQSNLNSEDSLTSIIAELQMETDTWLSTNQQKYVGAITFAGAWVESMYIGSKVYEHKKNGNVSQRISEQMTILGNLLKTLNAYQSKDAHIAELVSALKKLEDSYQAFDEVKKMSSDNDEVAKLNEQHIDELSKEIESLRQKFVS